MHRSPVHRKASTANRANTYTYDPAKPWRLNSIVASDGRAITLAYSAVDQVTSVSDGSRTWSYAYNTAASGGLSTVTQPDGAQWLFALSVFSNGATLYGTSPECETEGQFAADVETGSITHPSGAVGTFQIQPVTHGRSFVEQQCRGNSGDGSSMAVFPRYIANKAIIGKTISGPGLPSMTWSYAYSSAAQSSCWLTGNCLDYTTLEVTDPRSVLTRYTFGNRFKVTEGQLQKVEVVQGALGTLRTTTMSYRSPSAGPYPSQIGVSAQRRGDSDLASRFAPMSQRVVTQQGVDFTWSALGASDFDEFARPLNVTRASSLGTSRSESTTYADNRAIWVLGQTQSVSAAGVAQPMVTHSFDPSTALLTSTTRFGLLDQSYTYWPDGTLKTRKDALNQTTSFSNYKRGLSQNVSYADGSAESAEVDNRGLITAVTDANGYVTGYAYDTIGRLNQITPPAGDSVGWNSTSLVFEPVASSEYDLPAGHWRQTVTTGAATTVTYFDGLWRQRLTRTFDAASEAGTRSMVLRNFDADNRTTFESYPARSIASVNAAPAGVATQYDALGPQYGPAGRQRIRPLNDQQWLRSPISNPPDRRPWQHHAHRLQRPGPARRGRHHRHHRARGRERQHQP